jgi:predicted ATPase
MNPGMIRRITLQNYRSIAQCRVDLQPLTFLVGRNGAGKSNFLDAFQFVSDTQRLGLDQAVESRDGFDEIIHRSPEKAQSFAMRLDFTLADGREGHYSFAIEARADGEPVVKRQNGYVPASFESGEQEVSEIEIPNLAVNYGQDPSNASNKKRQPNIHKFSLSEISEFVRILRENHPDKRQSAHLYKSGNIFREMFRKIAVYNIMPLNLRKIQKARSGKIMGNDGTNTVGAFQNLTPAFRERVVDYLCRIVPEVSDVLVKDLGDYKTFEFVQKNGDQEARFLASQMSDGTLRALGILLAAFQGIGQDSKGGLGLVGLEEPEAGLHPAAVRVLLQALQHASEHRQILVTSHSPGLLDDWNIAASQVIAVDTVGGSTRLGPVDPAAVATMNDHLMTAGELLQQNQLSPDKASEMDQPLTEADLFGEELPAAGGATEE